MTARHTRNGMRDGRCTIWSHRHRTPQQRPPAPRRRRENTKAVTTAITVTSDAAAESVLVVAVDLHTTSEPDPSPTVLTFLHRLLRGATSQCTGTTIAAGVSDEYKGGDRVWCELPPWHVPPHRWTERLGLHVSKRWEWQ